MNIENNKPENIIINFTVVFYSEEAKPNTWGSNDKVYEFTDGSWFICDNAENEYVFQPIELGDWDYELENQEQLEKIMATYFINKYNIEEDKAIQEINKILEEVDI